tara:strand:+ start:10543 stop:10908 length:366 start_codon:yes stop_codon:yes gene_type:complete
MKKKLYRKKNYKRLSRFDKALIMGLIINILKNNQNIKRLKIHKYINNEEQYRELVKNLGFIGSEELKKQYEFLIDNNLGKLIKNGLIMISKDKKYFLTSHGEEIWVKYNRDWVSMPPLNKQ